MLSSCSRRARRSAHTTRLRIVALVCVPGLLACGAEHATSPRSRGQIGIASGNAQHGLPGQRLDQPIVLVVRDPSGAAMAGVQVTWVADDGGEMDPAVSLTDANGFASATWTLGIGAMHRGRAVATGFATAELTASSDVNATLPLDVIVPLDLKTYDGSGQTVHPDYVATGPTWTGASQYLFITPYPNGNANFENPSIFESEEPTSWLVPERVKNPIVSPHDGYFSDPDAVYVPERNELWLYFRQVASENTIRLTTSRDGLEWTAPVDVARAPNHEIISPSVVRRAPNDWLMWSVNGNVGCSGSSAAVELRRSINGVDWSVPEAVGLTQPGFSPWHIDVEWIESRSEFWALYNVKIAGSCTTSAVYLATSADGVHWRTYMSPVLARGAIDALRDVVYRSSFAYDPSSDAVTIWFSGARFEGTTYSWHTAVQRRLRADLFSTIASPAKAAFGATTAVPQLREFP